MSSKVCECARMLGVVSTTGKECDGCEGPRKESMGGRRQMAEGKLIFFLCLCVFCVCQTKEKLEALRECVASKDGELGNCVAEANALKKANDDTMDRYAKEELKFTAAEENAWENCGSLAFATSEDHANLIVYCSMQAACPQEFSSWMTCLGKNDNDVHKCRTETRALLQGFRVYLEKSYIRDPTFFMRLDMKFEKDHF